MDQLKMYSLLKMGIFHCYVSLLEGSCIHAFILFPGKDARVRPVKSNCSGLRWLISRESTGLHKIRVGDVSWLRYAVSEICMHGCFWPASFCGVKHRCGIFDEFSEPKDVRNQSSQKMSTVSILVLNMDSFRFCMVGISITVYLLLTNVWSNFTNISGWNFQMDVSENNGTPKSSILIGFSIINHPFWGTPIFGNTQIALILPKPPCSLLRLESFSGFREQEQRNMEAHRWFDGTINHGNLRYPPQSYPPQEIRPY